jgi:hypothetical protein
MGSGPNHGIYFGGDQRRFFVINMDTTTEDWSTLPKVPTIALKFHAGEPLTEVMRHAVHRNISASGHVVVETNRLVVKAA